MYRIKNKSLTKKYLSQTDIKLKYDLIFMSLWVFMWFVLPIVIMVILSFFEPNTPPLNEQLIVRTLFWLLIVVIGGLFLKDL